MWDETVCILVYTALLNTVINIPSKRNLTMYSIRYYIALFIVSISPGVFFYWFSVHPFIRFWRRVGVRWTLGIHCGVIGLLAAVVIYFRQIILAVEYGNQPLLFALGLVCMVPAAIIRIRQAKQFSNSMLIGLPELAPERADSRLVTEGIYSRMRHPRYLELLFTFLAYALLANYLAMYVVCLLSMIWVAVLIRVEEQELRARFGADYDAYCEKVPRLGKW